MCDEKLIRAVEKRRSLYDLTHVLYKNNGYRKKIWNDIAIEIGMPVDVCQKQWKRLRERYSELNKKGKSGNAAKSRKYSNLLVTMAFLKPYLKDNPKFLASSLVELDTANPTIIEHSMDNNSSSTSLRSFFMETDPETLDEDYLFINSASSSSGVVASPSSGVETLPSSSVVASSSSSRAVASPSSGVVTLPSSSVVASSSSSGAVASTPKRNRMETNKPTDISELIAVLKEPTPEYDSVDYYCMSLAADMKKMEPSEQRRIRLEITNIMCTAKYKD